LQEIRVDDGIALALWTAADPLELSNHSRQLHRVSSVQFPGTHGRVAGRRAWRDVSVEQSIHEGRSMVAPARPREKDDSDSQTSPVRDRCLSSGPRFRDGWTHQYRDA